MRVQSGYRKEQISTFFRLPDIEQIPYLEGIERDILCYLTEQTLRNQDHPFDEPAILLAANFGKKTFGHRFSEAKRNLINHKVIFNVPYDGGFYRSHKLGLCEQFRLCSEAIEALHKKKFVRIPTVFSFNYPKRSRRKPVIVSKYRRFIAPPRILAKMAGNYPAITIRREWRNWFAQNNEKASVGCLRHSLAIFSDILTRQLHISQGSKTSRVSHPVLNLKRELRQFIEIDGEKMAEIDGDEFHPHLLATFLDGTRQTEYLDYVKRGLYDLFTTEKITRDSVKQSFQVFLSGYKTFNGSVADKIRWWFEQYFPEIIERIAEEENGIQATLQTIEANLFVQDIFASCPIWSLTMHDGMCCKESDAEELKDFISKRIVDHLGFPIPLTTKIHRLKKPKPELAAAA